MFWHSFHSGSGLGSELGSGLRKEGGLMELVEFIGLIGFVVHRVSRVYGVYGVENGGGRK